MSEPQSSLLLKKQLAGKKVRPFSRRHMESKERELGSGRKEFRVSVFRGKVEGKFAVWHFFYIFLAHNDLFLSVYLVASVPSLYG